MVSARWQKMLSPLRARLLPSFFCSYDIGSDTNWCLLGRLALYDRNINAHYTNHILYVHYTNIRTLLPDKLLSLLFRMSNKKAGPRNQRDPAIFVRVFLTLLLLEVRVQLVPLLNSRNDAKLYNLVAHLAEVLV